jgi:hypothetical protein
MAGSFLAIFPRSAPVVGPPGESPLTGFIGEIF